MAGPPAAAEMGPVPELAPEGADIWLDGGHNEDCGRVLAQAMADFEDMLARPLVVICGTLATKDTGAFLRPFKGLAQEVIAVPVTGEHRAAGQATSRVSQRGRHPGGRRAGLEQALLYLAARDWPVPPRIFIAGSLYLAGEVLAANGMVPD